jgi:hypothetical protein
MKRWFGITALALLACAVALPANAQGNTKKQVQGYIAGGYVLSEGDTGNAFDDGWDISGGVLLRPSPDKPIALRFDLGYNWFDANNALINKAQTAGLDVDDGYMSVGTLTAEALWEFGGNGGVGGFIGVGLGGYHRYANLSTTVIQAGYICDPYWYWCYPGAVQGQAIVGSNSLTKFGYSVAGGVTFPVGNGEMYVEARYHWMDASDPSTQMLPILLGYRF